MNLQTLKTRSLTAVVFVAVMLAGLLLHRWGFVALFATVHFGCWWEYGRLQEKIHKVTVDRTIKALLMVIGGLLLYFAAVPNATNDTYVNLGSLSISLKYLLGCFLGFCLLVLLQQNKQLPNKAKAALLAGLVYITLPCCMMVAMPCNIPNGPVDGIDYHWMDTAGKNDYFHRFIIVPCCIVAAIWINDTMAYIVGSLIGKTPFSSISPKKTWEGTGGGALLCVGAVALLAWLTALLPVPHAAVIAAICAVFGTAGDLLESKLKRLAGVKDSGHFMPGHGGFLDRFDSMLVAIPPVWVFCKVFL